jgi:hypothetical protein
MRASSWRPDASLDAQPSTSASTRLAAFLCPVRTKLHSLSVAAAASQRRPPASGRGGSAGAADAAPQRRLPWRDAAAPEPVSPNQNHSGGSSRRAGPRREPRREGGSRGGAEAEDDPLPDSLSAELRELERLYGAGKSFGLIRVCVWIQSECRILSGTAVKPAAPGPAGLFGRCLETARTTQPVRRAQSLNLATHRMMTSDTQTSAQRAAIAPASAGWTRRTRGARRSSALAIATPTCGYWRCVAHWQSAASCAGGAASPRTTPCRAAARGTSCPPPRGT